VGLTIDILPLHYDDINNILRWNDGASASFLEQWAGRGYSYPITREQVINRMRDKKSSLYKIVLYNSVMAGGVMEDRAKMIGTVELSNHSMPRNSSMVCRFLMAPAYQSRGYGTLALMMLSWKAFTEWGCKHLRLRVFAYNERAVRCYTKAGFKLKKVIMWDDGREVYEMCRAAPRLT
jgi:RimJ/RimL family protein N-acetyltransferase